MLQRISRTFRASSSGSRRWLWLLALGGLSLLVLMIVAVVVLYHTTYDMATTRQPFAQAATTAVNGVLFAIIIMEVMRTVMAHFDRGGLQQDRECESFADLGELATAIEQGQLEQNP